MDNEKNKMLAVFGGDAVHGGDVWGWSRVLGRPVREILDLSASLNPLGPPPGLTEAVQASTELVCHYPDRLCYDLRQALAAKLGLDAACLLPGNGSTALIRMITRVLDLQQIMLLAPAFGEFGRSLALAGRHFHYLIMRERNSFAPVEADLERVWEEQPSAVILCNPVSPTGQLVAPDVLDKLLAKAHRRRAWVVVDEAFIDFAPPEARAWALSRVQDYPHLVVLRSMTKFYCIAGLRLGYALAHADTLGDLAPMGQPWSVNTLAQAAGVYCLAQSEYEEQTRTQVSQWRAQQAASLAELGLMVLPSQANYMLCRLPLDGPTAPQVAESCALQGVLVRDASSFVGCEDHHLRVAVAAPADQPRLLAAIKQALSGR
ncbi:MAG: threonine-phosphate decarboxylase [Desulfarculus sp.]|nr:MAG: threonine-phosphate decarboxylase [Desulfarculus sp.]